MLKFFSEIKPEQGKKIKWATGRYLGMTLDVLEAQQDQAKAVEQVRKDVFEEACVLICQDCRNNHPLELHPDYGIYQHKHKRTGEYEDCKADAIRWEMASGSR